MRNVLSVLLDACVAAPADDAPRLEWANFVGGERGELVALQCALSRGGIERNEALAWRRREADLLALDEAHWADLEGLADAWAFRRGFVDEAVVDVRTFAAHGEELFRRAPLLRLVHLAGMSNGDPETIVGLLDAARSSPAFPRLRGLRLREVGRTVETDRDTHPLDFESAGSEALARLIQSGGLHSLRGLELPRCALSARDIARLADCPDAAGLVELDLRHQDVDCYMGIYPGDVQKLVDSPHLARLESLDIAGALGRAPWLAGQTRAERREANLAQARRDPALLAHPRILGLRRLGIALSCFADAMIDALANAPFQRLEWLNVSQNDIFPDDFAKIGAAPGYDRLVELVFDGPSQYVFSTKMAEALGAATRFGCLRTLRLRNCMMSLATAKALCASNLARRLEVIDLRLNQDLAGKHDELQKLWDGILFADSR